MAVFRFRAYTTVGDLSEGDIEAASREEAEEALWARGLTPFDTREIKSRETGGLFRSLFKRRGATLAEIVSFTREFATLQEANLPLDQGLRILSMQNASSVLRDLSDGILRQIVDGVALSDALTKRPDVFTAEYINVVRAGEARGDIGAALSELADMLERRHELRSRLQAALVYPAILIALAIGSTVVVLGVLVPNVAPIFADGGKPMPSGLQFIIDLEEQWPYVVGFLVTLGGSIAGFLAWSADRPHIRSKIDHAVLRIPFVGALKVKHETARFARTLGALTKAGVPLLSSLQSARSVVADRYLGGQIDEAIESVRGGASLSKALARIDRFPSVATQMVIVGEEAGKVDEMLLRVANMFERQTQRSIERVMGLFTPMLTVVIAAVVGALIMSVMNAVLSINELATK